MIRPNRKNYNFGCGLVAIAIPAMLFIWLMVDNAFYGDVYQSQKRQEAAIAVEAKEARSEAFTAFYANVLLYTENAFYGATILAGIAGVIGLAYLGAINAHKRMLTEKEKHLPEQGVYSLLPVADGVLFNPNTQQFIDAHTMRVIQSEYTPQAMMIDGAIRKLNTYDGQHRMNAAEAKLYAGHYDRALPAGTPTATPGYDLLPDAGEEIVPIRTINEALEHSDKHDWIIGTSGTGALSWFNVLNDANALLVGSAGSGKTASTAMMMVLHARLNNYAVTVLDGKDGLDWKPIGDAGLVDWRPLDHTNMGFYVEALQQEYKRRNEVLAANGCRNLGEYTGGDMPRMLVVIEELGGTVQDIKTYGGDAKLIVGQLGGLMKRCRAAGIHFLLIDQSPEKDTYPNGVKVNARYFAYRLPGHQAKVVNAPDECRFLDVGQFIDDGEIYQAWHTDKQYPLIKNIGKMEWCNLLPSPQKSGLTSSVTDSVTDSVMPVTTYNQSVTTSEPAEINIDWQRYGRLKGDRLRAALIEELPKLDGEPVDQHEIDYVLDAYCNLSKNNTYFAVWGGKNGQRMEWLNDIIDTHSDGETVDYEGQPCWD